MPGLRRVEVLLVFVLALFCAGVWSVILSPYFYGSADGRVQTPAAVEAARVETVKQSSSLQRVVALLAGAPAALAPRSKTTSCVVAGPLPDRECTPGSVFADATPAKICVSGYTKRVRSVSTKLRKQLFAAYGVAYPPPTGAYELDHLVPLALGRDNSPANLFPQPAKPEPRFKAKDVVEVYLQEGACAGQLD